MIGKRGYGFYCSSCKNYDTCNIACYGARFRADFLKIYNRDYDDPVAFKNDK